MLTKTFPDRKPGSNLQFVVTFDSSKIFELGKKKIPATDEVSFTKIKNLRERDARPLIQKLHLM